MGPERSDGRRVPRWISRPFHQYFGNIDVGEDPGHPWFASLRDLAKRMGCAISYFPEMHWSASACGIMGDGTYGIDLGGKGRPAHVCTVLLHEIGHIAIKRERRQPRDKLSAEEAAWEVAADLAGRLHLPFVAMVRRRGLDSYRQTILRELNRGSKRSARRRPPPKVEQLMKSEGSKGMR